MMLSVFDPGPLLAHMSILLLVGGITLAVGRRAAVLPQTSISLILHLGVAVGIFATSGLFAPDAAHYDRLGLAYQDYWFGDAHQAPIVTTGKEGIPAMLALLYQAFGHYPFLGVLMNVGMATLLVPLVASTSKVLGIDHTVPAWLAGCLPPLLLWGSLLLREAAAWILLALIVRGLAGLATGEPRPVVNWVSVLAPLVPLVAVRGTAALLVGSASLIAFAVTARSRVIPVLVGAIGLIVAGPALVSMGEGVAGGYDVNAINQQRAALSRSADSSFEVETYDSFGSMLLAAPMAMLRGLAAPFPWELPSLGPFLILDTLVWWGLAVTFVIGVTRFPDRRLLLSLLIPAVTLLVVLAITSGNYGTMTRLRYQSAVMLLPVGGFGLTVMLAYWRSRRAERHRRASRQVRARVRAR